MKVRTLWQKAFWSSRLAWWSHTPRTVLLVVEIKLGEKFGGQAYSRGKADQNTREELLAQNLFYFCPPQTTGLFCAVPGDWILQLQG